MKREDELVPMFIEDTKSSGYTYSIGDYRFIFEFVVLEYGFAFWQWQYTNCTQIPDTTTSNEDLFEHLKTGSSFSYFSDQDIESNLPFIYQAYSQMGYYGYDISTVKDLLTEVKEPTSRIFLPKYMNPVFDCCIMQDINSWIQKHGNNMIFIYGEIDAWSSTAIELTGETNSIKMIKLSGNHRTRIKSFNDEDQEFIINTIEDWIGYEVQE